MKHENGVGLNILLKFFFLKKKDIDAAKQKAGGRGALSGRERGY